MRILFLGAGALGGYFGGRMTAGGADVTLLVRANRQTQVAGGVQIISPLGDARIPVRTITTDQTADPFDVSVLTNKAYGLTGALEAIAPFVGPSTAIVPLLNGMAHYAAIQTRFPGTPVLGGVAHIPAEMRADGTIVHRGKLQRLTIGPRAGQDTRAVAEALVAAAQAGGVDAKVSDTIEQALWDKWVMLTSLAAGTCLMRGDVGQICRTDHGIAFMASLVAECTSVADAEGFAPSERQQGIYRDQLLNPQGTFKASMLHDLENGNLTEAQHILGDMIGRAAAHGIEVPMLKAALSHLQVYEAARA